MVFSKVSEFSNACFMKYFTPSFNTSLRTSTRISKPAFRALAQNVDSFLAVSIWVNWVCVAFISFASSISSSMFATVFRLKK